ncbi:cation diffusion facilitator family transporter [Lysinibacillus fusiformis]|uniref:cation diffusion facilitator family transporter n=1 Tax=Lysinibacillus fusiformis TaxID=28031 RepID=UPI0035C13BA7|nr:cation diffusion facilitator family transporter [Lysinibacillus fusiformis]
MSKENMELFLEKVEVEGTFDFDELESKLEHEIELQMTDLQLLKEEQKQIGNEDNLGEIIKGVVWEQFMNQVAAKAGADFIAENQDLKLDLRKDAHIQTNENFEKGKIATHNTKIKYQKRYDDWQSNFKKDENGNVVTHTTRSGKKEATLVEGARNPFDNGRPSGSVEKHTDMDHTVSAAEIIRDPAANAHMTKKEQIAFANSEANLNEIDLSLNRSKGDKSTTEWLDNPNTKGQKPNEIFDISDEDDKKLRLKDAEAREEYEKQKKEAEQKSIEVGKKSQKEEAFRIGGKALRSAIMLLFAELVKEVIGKLVKWLKSAQKSLKTLMEHIKEAIKSFSSKLKIHLKNTSNNVLTTILTAIYGPIVATIKKVWILLKQGWKSLKEAVNYLKNPDNQDQPLGIRLLETGKIVMAGLSAVSAIVLGQVIEKSLMTIPFLAVEIPLLGSLANLIGLFAGGLTAGIIGAIAINLIDKAVEKKQKEFNLSKQIEKSNEILNTQAQLIVVGEEKLADTKGSVSDSIARRHAMAQDEMTNSLKNIFGEDEDASKNNEDSFDDMERIIKGLLD